MSKHKTTGLSESEEMYLVTIARLVEEGEDSPIPISSLAREMNILPVSANQMIRKLADDDLVTYVPYKGAQLTRIGQRKAAQIIRRRRLWEVFLVKKLGLPFNEAEELACRFEHITPASATNRLAEFLGNPEINPLGNIIPESEQSSTSQNWIPLSDLQLDQTAHVMQIKGDTALRSFLANEGIGAGSEINILGVGNQGIVIAEVNKKAIRFSKKVSDSILVKIHLPALIESI